VNKAADPKTEELRVEQDKRETQERRREREAASEDEADQHSRRAQRSAYLKGKLEERAESEKRKD
jgi:hypothetical protein